jgi:hypothetical protein
MEITAGNRWMFNYILVHVARTWERIRVTRPYQEMPLDNIESVEAIEEIATSIFEGEIIQKFLNASNEEKADDFWDKNTNLMSDSFIEGEAEKLIFENFLK